MRFLWFVLGIATGFAVAHQLNKTPEGKRFFESIDGRARQFGAAVADGYHAREEEIRSLIEETKANPNR